MLLEKPGDLVTREEIRTILWPQGTFIDFDHSLNAAVRRLREAPDDNADTPRFVETLPRRGYRFVAPVEAISTEGVGSEEGCASKAVVLAAEATQSAASPGEDVAPQKVAGRAATPLWKILALVAPVMAAFAIAAVVLSMRSSEAVNSIAVLPFANATGDASLLYLSDGIAESVINNLSQVPGLKVMSRNSAFRYRQPDLKPNRVASELGVGALLMGAVQQHGDEVPVSVELVDGKDEHQIWGEEYTRGFSDLSGIQADIAQEISQRLRIAGPAQSRVARHDTDNSEAYRLYLRGKFALETRKNSDALTALRYFEQAAHLDRNYALAYSGMAHSYALLAFYGGMAPHQAYPLETRRCIRR
jgi:TolB-like protein/DNA-binding winged helix-turn-helix (wHTH) protein